MKKENKELAKQRRAAERKKQKQKAFVKKLCSIGIPVLLITVFVIYVTLEAGSSNNSNDEAAYQTDTTLSIKDGDTVNIDYVGYVDGVAFEGGNTQGGGADLTIGSGRYIDDFEDQLIGAHPGDTVEVTVTFPENYGNESLNGKDALFEVVINGIYE